MKIRLSDAGHLRSTLGNKELGFAMKKKKTKRPSCEDYFRMPLAAKKSLTIYGRVNHAALCSISLRTT